MPGKRFNRGSKTNRPMRGYRSKTQVIAHNEAKHVVKRELQREIETKMFDGQITVSAIDYNGSSASMWVDQAVSQPIIRGTSNNEYIGDTVKIVGLKVRYQIFNGDTNNMMRIIVVQFKTAGLAPADVLQSVGNIRTPLSDFDKDHLHEFRVLYDKLVPIHNQDTTILENKTFSFYIPGKKFTRVRFSDNVGTVSAGQVSMYIYSDSSIASHPTIAAFHRISYKDA